MNLRCRGPKGQFTLSGVEPCASVASLQQRLAEATGISRARLEVLSGFPPKPLKADAPTLADAGLQNGDTLVVWEGAAPAAAAAAAAPVAAASPVALTDSSNGVSHMTEDEQLAKALAASLEDVAPPKQPAAAAAAAAPAAAQPRQSHHPAPRPAPAAKAAPPAAAAAARSQPAQSSQTGAPTAVALPDGSAVVRRVIASDNSCLFNAVGYTMERSRSCAPRLRRVIAETVAADPATYTEGFLGKGNAEYQRWIQDSQRWGGAIELSILARHYGREIAAFDIQTQRVDVYGQGSGYSERAMVIYDGLHYDALSQAAFADAPEDLDVTIFETARPQMPAVHRAAKELVAKAHAARQFTDVGSFTLRCGVCQIGVRGEKEAVAHAQQTGHQNFTEYH